MTEEEIKNLEFLKKEYSEIPALRNEMNKNLVNRRIETVNQRRDFLKFIVYLIAAIIGSSYFLNVSKSRIHYFTGIILLVSVIVFIILYLRETLDIDDINLRDLQDKYNLILDEKSDFVLNYITTKKYSDIDMENYFRELKNLSCAKELANDVKKDREAMKNRGKELLDYSGELIVFLFLSGIFFIVSSVFPSHFNWIIILFGEIIILLVACTNFAKLISRIFSFVINYIKKGLK